MGSTRHRASGSVPVILAMTLGALLPSCGDAGGREGTSLSGGVGSITAADPTTGGDDDVTTATTSGSTTMDGPGSTTTGLGTTTGIDPSASSGGDVSTGGEPGPGATCPPVGEPDCSPGPGSGEGDTCFDLPSCFLQTVKSAVNATLDAHPEWFDYTDGQPLVLDVEAYMNTVVETVSAQGLCAIRDPNAGDEIAVKHDQSGAESFDILTADGHARYGDGIYTAVCSPSWF